jgi:hypothetical protein
MGLAHARDGKLTDAIEAFTCTADQAERIQLRCDCSCRSYRRSLLALRSTVASTVSERSTADISGLMRLGVALHSAADAFTRMGFAPAKRSEGGQTSPVSLSGAMCELPLADQFCMLVDALLAEKTDGSLPALASYGMHASARTVTSPLRASSPTTATGFLAPPRKSCDRGAVMSSTQRLALCQKLAFRFSRVLMKSRAGLQGSGAAAAAARGALQLRLLACHERAKALQLAGRHAEAVEDFTDFLVNCPGATSAFFRRGFSLRALRCFACAADDLETARTMIPRDERFNINYSGLQNVQAIVVNAAGAEPSYSIVGLEDMRDGFDWY